MDIDQEIRAILAQIRAIRNEKGISQESMGQALGISQNAYKNIEIGQTELKFKTLHQIMGILGIDFSHLARPGENKEKTLIPIDENTIRELREDIKEIKNKVAIFDKLEAHLSQLEAQRKLPGKSED